MICFECMQEKEEKDWALIHYKDPEDKIGDFCVCLTCAIQNLDHPTLKSIH